MLRGYCQSHSNMSCYLFTSPLCCLFKISFVFTDSQILTSKVNVFFSLTCLLLVLSNSKPNFDSDQPKTKRSLSKQRSTDVITSFFGFVSLSSYHHHQCPTRLYRPLVAAEVYQPHLCRVSAISVPIILLPPPFDITLHAKFRPF